MALPLDMLMTQASDPTKPSGTATFAILLCYWCGHLGNYSLHLDRWGEDQQIQFDRCFLLSRLLRSGLKCEQWETCDSRPPMIETYPASTPESACFDRREANTASAFKVAWGDLRCEHGHPIPLPQP
jgi:hypothetical protein